MSSALPQSPYPPPRRDWTRLECQALESSGVFDQERLELVDGELIAKMGKKRPHVNVVTFVTAWLVRIFGAEFVNVEAPVDVAPEDNPASEPEPDLIVLNRPSQQIRNSNPRPADLRLVVEVADSTLAFDLTKKAALYARAGIVDYWVFDLQERRLIVHREPQAGKYLSIEAYGEWESVAPLSAPEASFAVRDAFGDEWAK